MTKNVHVMVAFVSQLANNPTNVEYRSVDGKEIFSCMQTNEAAVCQLQSLLRAEGGWNVLLRVPSVLDENELVLAMIERHGVSGQPGYFFDMTSNGYLAISLLPEPEDFRRNVQIVLDTVNELIG